MTASLSAGIILAAPARDLVEFLFKGHRVYSFRVAERQYRTSVSILAAGWKRLGSDLAEERDPFRSVGVGG